MTVRSRTESFDLDTKKGRFMFAVLARDPHPAGRRCRRPAGRDAAAQPPSSGSISGRNSSGVTVDS